MKKYYILLFAVTAIFVVSPAQAMPLGLRIAMWGASHANKAKQHFEENDIVLTGFSSKYDGISHGTSIYIKKMGLVV